MPRSVHALVVRQTPYKEYDILLTVLSAEEGKLTVNARGARRAGSQKAAASQLLCYSRMLLSEYRDHASLTEAEILDSFPRLREDVERMALGAYLADTAALFMPEQEPAEDIHRLALAALSLLSHKERDPRIVKAVTEFSSLCRAGFAPALEGCTSCGQTAPPLHLHLEDGLLLCPRCKPAEYGAALCGGVLAALRHMQAAPIGKAFSFILNDTETERLGQVCEDYLLHQTGKLPATLAFYKGLIVRHERINR